MLKFDALRTGCYDRTAGWSSLVARWAHNPKVGGSNPPPATNSFNSLRAPAIRRFLILSVICPCSLTMNRPVGAMALVDFHRISLARCEACQWAHLPSAQFTPNNVNITGGGLTASRPSRQFPRD